MDSSVSSAQVADTPLSVRAFEPCVEDELAPDAQGLLKALLGDDINYFWHDATCVHTALQEVCASCHSIVQGGGVVCFLVPAGGLQAERGTDRGRPFPRGVPLFLAVTSVCSCIPGGVGLVVMGPRVVVCAQGNAMSRGYGRGRLGLHCSPMVPAPIHAGCAGGAT